MWIDVPPGAARCAVQGSERVSAAAGTEILTARVTEVESPTKIDRVAYQCPGKRPQQKQQQKQQWRRQSPSAAAPLILPHRPSGTLLPGDVPGSVLWH